MYKSKGSVGRQAGGSILSALKATEMIDSKASLPAGTYALAKLQGAITDEDT